MKGVIFDKVGAQPEVVDTLTKPEPADDQILVRSIWTAINPVDAFMSQSGILVVEWPLVLGVDAAGVVISAGQTAQSKYNFKPGDYVCGCTRLGYTQYSTSQEYHLMDARVTIPKPQNWTVQQSATLGVGATTACLALFQALPIPLPDPTNLPSPTDKYLLVLGGASSVGKFAIQIAREVGYKVLATCSANSNSVVKSLGAEPVDYKQPLAQQVQQVISLVGGDEKHLPLLIFDATATDDPALAKEIFKLVPDADGSHKAFSTTNDWSGIPDFNGGKTTWISLGPIGRPEATDLNRDIESYIPIIVSLAEQGKLVPSDISVVGGEDQGGFQAAADAYAFQTAGKGGNKKVLVRIGKDE